MKFYAIASACLQFFCASNIALSSASFSFSNYLNKHLFNTKK